MCVECLKQCWEHNQGFISGENKHWSYNHQENYVNCKLNYERQAHASMRLGLIQRSLIKSGDTGSDKSRWVSFLEGKERFERLFLAVAQWFTFQCPVVGKHSSVKDQIMWPWGLCRNFSTLFCAKGTIGNVNRQSLHWTVSFPMAQTLF